MQCCNDRTEVEHSQGTVSSFTILGMVALMKIMRVLKMTARCEV